MSKEINEDIFKQIDKEHSDDYKKHDELYRKAVENKYKEQDDAEERESDKLSHKDWAEKRFTNKNVKGSNKTRSRKIKKLRKDIDRMESAFESLENLNVSEECFNDIVGLVEDIFSQIKKVHGEPDKIYDYSHVDRDTPYEDIVGIPKDNKAAELSKKADKSRYDEVVAAAKREGKSEREIENKRRVKKN